MHRGSDPENKLEDIDEAEEGSLQEREDTKPFKVEFTFSKEDADKVYGYLARTAPDGFPKIDFIPNPEDNTVTMILVAKMDGRRRLAKGLRFIYELIIKVSPNSAIDDSQAGKKKAHSLNFEALDTVFDRTASPPSGKPIKPVKSTKIAA